MISPRSAFCIISFGALAGPLIAGTAVAATIGHGIVDYSRLGGLPLSAGIAGGLSAVLLAYAFRFPTSGSVALMGATLGSLAVLQRLGALEWAGILKVVISLLGSIVAGVVAGACVYLVAIALSAHMNYQTGMRLMRLQYVTVGLQAFGYGANDAEKMMGLMVAATLLAKPNAHFVVPFWVIVTAVLAFVGGMAIGGVRIARTIGGKLFHIRPLHALAFQTASAATVLTAAALGGPLSTTETTASAIMGVGAVANPRAVRWLVARELVMAWLITLPIAALCGAMLTAFLRFTRLLD